MQQIRPTVASLQELRNFSFLNNDAVLLELPCYLANADGTQIETEDEKVQWRARHEAILPNWSLVVKKILLSW